MGTNYYWYEKPKCPTCGHSSGGYLHIGKSFAGWCFSLHVDYYLGVENLDDWKKLWDTPGSLIEDEYGRTLTKEEMLSIITERSHPDGLLRPIYDNACPGGPTWDNVKGEFS